MKFLILLILAFPFSITFSQGVDSIKIENNAQRSNAQMDKSSKWDSISVVMLTPPFYKGGLTRLSKDLNKKVKLNKSTNGMIYIHFTVKSNGKAIGFKTIKGLSEEIDNKYISALKDLQNWEPAISKEQNIDYESVVMIKIHKGKVKY